VTKGVPRLPVYDEKARLARLARRRQRKIKKEREDDKASVTEYIAERD